MGEVSTGRFSEICCQSGSGGQEWWSNLLADLVTVTKSARQENLLGRIGGVGNLLGRFSDCHEICKSGNLLADIGRRVNILTDLVTVIKSARNGKCTGRNWKECAGRFSDCH